jgi:hypothetical protein
MAKSPLELCAIGVELHRQGDSAGAKLHFAAALSVDADCTSALGMMAEVLSGENKVVVARVYAERLCSLCPENLTAESALANILMRCGEYVEAEVVARAVLAADPDVPGARHNLALILHATGRFEEALCLLDQVEQTAGVRNDRAHMLLCLGRSLQKAMQDYDARWDTGLDKSKVWGLGIPEWKGEDLVGRRLLVHAEQGYGDTIMTARFIPELISRGVEVTVAVQASLMRLLNAQGWGCEIVDLGKVAGNGWDFHSPLYSAMRLLGTEWDTISSSSYLRAPEVVVPPVSEGELNVGISWASGKRGGPLDWRRRVIPVELWATLAAIPGVRLWSLQKDVEGERLHEFGLGGVVSDPTAIFHDWADAAAFVSGLDLVVSVDTAVVHLAGALGVPVWMLSQYVTCWRWQGAGDGNGWPWYGDGFRIFLQDEPGNWAGQIAEVREGLVHLVRQSHGRV